MNKLNRRYKTIPQPAKASVWFIIASILQKGISFITVPIFTRLLTPEEFGLINVYQSWLAILTIFATLTLWGGVFNNGMVKFEEDRESFLSSLQGLSSTITLLLFVIFLLFSEVISNLTTIPIIIMKLMFVQIIFTPALNLWSAKQRFDYKYKKLVFITLIMSIANPILGIIMVVGLDKGGLGRIFSIAIVQISIGLILYAKNFQAGKKFYNTKYWKYAFSMNIALIPHYLSQTILSQSDRIMINNIVGAKEAGIYSVAYSVGMIFLFVIISINSSLTPWMYKKLKDKSYKQIEKASSILLLMISILILVLISFAPDIIRLMAPLEYSEAIWVIPPISLSIYFVFLFGLFVNVEFYFEENKFIMLASIITAILNIILNILFIPLFGYVAAGYTTLISYIIYSIAHFAFMNKILSRRNINKIYQARKLLLFSLGLFILSWLITLTYELTIIRYLTFIIAIIVAVANRKKLQEKIKSLIK
jgi:O-antigen/teichoic acid export membrane protein